MPYYEQTCLRCLKQYTAGVNRKGYCPDCQLERQKERNAAHAARRKNGTVRHIGSTDICTYCNREYTVRSGSQTLCQECIDKGIKLNKTQINTKYRDTHYDSIHLYVPKGERAKIKEIARRRNMSLNEFILLGVRLAVEIEAETLPGEPLR